jgi:8-oxo-dGTP pyrophosphatase MutT (NUDIX family)
MLSRKAGLHIGRGRENANTGRPEYARHRAGVSVFDFINRLAYALFLTAKVFVTPVAFGANAAVFDADGRVLLVRHSYRRGWHFPGGGVARGEAPEVAVRRELTEEVGLTEGTFSLIGIYSQNVWWVGNVVAFYRVEGAKIDFHPSLEVREILWVAPDAAPPAGISAATMRRLAEIRGGAASPFW